MAANFLFIHHEERHEMTLEKKAESKFVAFIQDKRKVDCGEILYDCLRSE